MKKFFAVLTSLVFVLAPVASWSGPLLSGDGTGGLKSAAAGGLGGSSYVPVATTGPTTSTTTGIQNNGQNASGQQDNGKMMAMITAGVMAAMAAATCPDCGKRGTCGVCMGSIAGGLAAGLAASQMQGAENKSNAQVTSVNPTATPIASGAGSLTGLSTLKNLKTAAKSLGGNLSADGKKVTLADGTVIDGTTGSPNKSPLSASEKAMMDSALAKAKADFEKLAGKDGGASTAEMDEALGGSGSGSGTAASELQAGVAAAAATGRQPTSVAGAFKDFNGDKIGVAQDSLFEMMHRRYKLKGEDKSLMSGQ